MAEQEGGRSHLAHVLESLNNYCITIKEEGDQTGIGFGADTI